MVQATGIRVPKAQAEDLRRLLSAEGLLRHDLQTARTDDGVVFPVHGAPEGLQTLTHDFATREARPARYQDLLDWPEDELEKAPRAFDRLGDIVVVKVPEELSERAPQIGRALLDFHAGCRAVFQDRGVHGPFRTRDLVRIAGSGDTQTNVAEHGVRLVVDPARAYFSPRLADERARIVSLLEPGDRLIDLFGGVAALGVLAARAGAEVDTVDLNPDACALARDNVARNGVADRVTVHEGDAREVAFLLEPAHHVVMNLPHDAWEFVETALPLVRPGGTLHYHEILEEDRLEARVQELVARIEGLGRQAEPGTIRHVRTYATGVGHFAVDVALV